MNMIILIIKILKLYYRTLGKLNIIYVHIIIYFLTYSLCINNLLLNCFVTIDDNNIVGPRMNGVKSRIKSLS